MIDRYTLVTRHNPKLDRVVFDSPLTLGNGEFAFTADVTGMQTLYREYKNHHVPLCTMSQWGWHTTPAGEKQDIYYSMKDVDMTEYDYCGRKVYYAVEKKKGNEEVYDWLRQNPHRLNLARIAFYYEGAEIASSALKEIHQELNLYEGVLSSSFLLKGNRVDVVTICDYKQNGLAFSVKSDALVDGRLSVRISFPYGSPDISASDWEKEDRHSTVIDENTEPYCLCLKRQLDKDSYYVMIRGDETSSISQVRQHKILLKSSTNTLEFTVLFSNKPSKKALSVESVAKSSKKGFRDFWESGAAIDLHCSKDPRALELERRIVLSQYLTAIQSSGSLPPQETGLTCNSWYGKFHLEMYLWHCSWFVLWNRPEMISKSLLWYRNNLEKAKENAARNGYKGAKWPKMVAYDSIDSPSIIATLLIWQQPQIIFMLELVYQSRGEDSLLTQYWEVISETAEYMCDLAVYNPRTLRYDLPSPLIPAQEEHDPRETINPSFELEFWASTLKIAVQWAKRLGYPFEQWEKVANHMAELPSKDGLYLAHENCPLTYSKFNKDHPSMLGALGLLPGYSVDAGRMERSLNKVLECWNFSTMWGWDFAMMAMTAVRLGKPELAMDILMKDTPKNSYVISGNNYQRLREDLPLYLPGNASLLMAVALMSAGYKGCKTKLPGFPQNGMWEVEFEGMMQFPY